MRILFPMLVAFAFFTPVMAAEQVFRVGGMHCEACSKAIEKAVKKIEGVESVSVDFKSGEMKITSAQGANIPQKLVAQAVTDAGYQLKK